MWSKCNYQEFPKVTDHGTTAWIQYHLPQVPDTSFVGGCIKLFQAHANVTGSFCKMIFHPDMERLLSSGNLPNTCQQWPQPSTCSAHSPNTFPQMSVRYSPSARPYRQNCHLLAVHHRMICHMIFFRVCQHPCELPPLPYLDLLFSWADWTE